MFIHTTRPHSDGSELCSQGAYYWLSAGYHAPSWRVLRAVLAMPSAERGRSEQRRPHTAVLVRSHNPLPGQLRRMREWATVLSAAGIPMHVSLDVSHGRETVERVSSALSPLPVAVHMYDEAEMVREFPHLERLRHTMVGEAGWSGLRCPATGTDARTLAANAAGTWRKWAGRGGTRPSSIAWGFHAEALCLWWRTMTRKPPDGSSPVPEHVWVIEDDVGFTAPLNELVEAYSDTHADLVTDAPQLSVPVSATSWAVTADAATGSGALRWQGWCDLTLTLALTPTLTLILTQSLTLTLALSLRLTRCWHDTCTEAYAALVPEEQP